ncbi:MAG: type I-C CRISPR-associated protein Cas8c/Csd1 [Sphaerochaetaceae bacterium]|nr:type I-C CRISPR-associated protein Cas8c/Csd1 [Sphaerochaetaceae bacterium]
MILQALYEYAQRKQDELSEDGFENLEIKYLILIDESGSLVDLISTIENKKGHVFAKVPKRVERSGIRPKASLLVDNVEYVISSEAKREAFISRIEALPDSVRNTKEISAVISFYCDNKVNGLDKITECELWDECKKSNGYISFKLSGSPVIIPQITSICDYHRSEIERLNEGDDGICLITGNRGTIARLHPATPIAGSKSIAKLVGFQLHCGYDSYGKNQAYNAPVSIKAASAYTRALNHLINSEKNSIIIGSDTVLFWAEKNTTSYDLESVFSLFFSKNSDDPDRFTREVKNLFTSVYTGKFNQDEVDSNFYVLCLSPNSARLSVRYWEIGKVSTFAKRIAQHFEDLEIVRASWECEYLSLHQILSAVAINSDVRNLPSSLMGEVSRSIFRGLPYPTALAHQCIRRIRAEQKVTRARAAILKACLNRKNRNKEVSMALDPNCDNKGYLLGRLFAVYERIQQDTHPGINATIADGFFDSASTIPAAVFARLTRLNRHHMNNYENQGLKIIREREIEEIMSKLDAFPSFLDIDQQAFFSIGYYHEKRSLFENNNQSQNIKGDSV